uniref:Nonribosomal peptide synthetase 8 n=1 Tax=Cochliobolus lunatus TaxID=5503 RepID=A0A1W6BSA0_COCLU|nr:nonribosomal peptide synthetase 8 [Curvularia lunata]
MHHIVSDGWSVDVLTRELGTCYSAAVRGQDPLSQMQPLPIQYRDFSVWQRQQAQVDEHDRQLEYWIAQLQTSRPAELLCDKPRPTTLSGHADVRTLEVDASLFARLQEFCEARGVTLFVVLLAAFRATHFRLTGQEDATIGTANANRDRSELRDMIGFFVNMQCLRITVEDETFEELVQQVQEVAVASLAGQDVPFERIVSKLKKERDLSRHPLVQLIFAVHSQRDLGKLMLEGVETESMGYTATSRFDLEFHFFQHLNGLRGEVIFSTDLYASETIENMLSLFRHILDACLKEPKVGIASMALLTEADYARLDGMGLVRVEQTAYPRDSNIVDLFRQQASAHPSRIAVKDASEEMSYAQLDAASDVLAGWLAKLSFTPETLVGVFAARSCQTIVAFLGILKANLAYLPFDVKIPAGRMEAILSSLPSGQRVILVGADVQPPDIKLNTVEFVRIVEALDEQMNEVSAPQEPAAPAAGPLATSLAYVMFTSGSTGQPKGVMVEHRGIVRLVRDNNLVQHLPVLPETRVMAHVTALAFDVSTWEIYACLLNGGTLVCVDAMTVLDLVAVSRIFHRTNINMAVLTPALFRHYAQEATAVLTNLEMLCLGGEALHPRDASEALRLIPGKAVNCYGPTENTGISAIFVLTEEEHCVNGVPIGRALSNSGAHVMDPDLRLVPLGVIGELVVTGDGLARGYTDPERNIDRFVSVTIASQTVKAYRTGDFARHRVTDGQLEYFGRMDGQVKIRGQRIELGEIEHVLRSHKRVSDAVAVLQQRDGDEVRLAGFVIVDEGAAMADEQVDDGDSNDGDEDESQHVGTWEQQFDNDIYSPINNIQSERIGRDFTGWTSMYDGSEIDEMEMNEWLDDTIHTMLNGSKPGSVLEIGSGTGMILFNLGDGLQSYVGLDPSRKAIEFVVKIAKSIPALADKVRLHKATAMDIGRLEPSVIANLASLNSVVQYFPSQEYLFKVVQELLQVTGIQTIFFGDVRSYALHREFLAARALRMAGDKATMADIRRMVTDMERVEAELLVDPAFFTALPGRLPELVEHVEILPKRMKVTNELSCYRYAAVIHVRSRSGPKREIQVVKEDEWIDFSERKLDRQSLQQQLRSLSGLSTAAVSNIPYSKTIVSRCLVEALDDMDADTRDAPGWLSSVYHQAQHKPSLSATDLVELAQESGCRVEISWNRQYSQRGGLDAIFHRSPPRNGENRRLFRFPTEHTDRPPHNLSSRPLRQRMLKKIQQQLLAMLQAQLPAYMVPQAITVLDAMPVTQNGKVDRKALEQRVQTERISKAPVQQSLSDGELRMQKLWARVLNIEADSIGLDDSFFRLGGESIAAMKLVGEARRHGVQLTVADLFRCPELAALASLDVDSRDMVVEEQIAAFSLLSADADAVHVREEVATSCGIDANLVEDVYPCSPLQEGLMSLTAKRAGDYIMQSVLELRADVDEHAFRAAWEQVAQSTAVLRTRIVQHSELGLLQAVVAEAIQWIETEGLEAYLDKDKSASMGLGDLLARYAVVKEKRKGQEEGAAAGKRWFVWTVHHALYDGWSLPRIMDAVEKAYRGADMQKQPGFRAFIKHLSRQDPDEAAAYWQKALGDCEATPFPALPVAVQQPGADATVYYQCPPLPKTASDATTSTLVRAAWAVLASQYTGLDDVVFGAVVTGRNAAMAGIEAMLGPTIATVPVRVRIERSQTVRAFLEGVQRQAMEMMPHEQTGLQRIAKMGADARHACGFQTLLVVQPAEDGFAGDSVLGAWRGNSELQGFTTYALMVQCTLAAEEVRITASFDERVIERWLVGKMLGQLSFVMQQLAAADAEMKVADIDTLPPDDKQQLWEWNADVPPAVERCVHDLFAEQAAAQPNAPAVCAWDGELTYSELDKLSTRLASHLTRLGVKPESIVPLCFEKSMWTVVAMLAVLKAGGAFMPLDPDHPSNRHKDILAQTKASLMLTSTQYASLWKATELEVVIVSEADLRQLSVGNGRMQNLSRPGNAAYVIFTSGSTGTPKGVVLQHQAVSTGCLGHGEAFGFTQHTRALQFASYTFDACITEIVTTLVFGGCVCVPSEGDRRDRLVSVINSLSINWALLTPSVARLLDPDAVPMLKVLVMGGEHVLSSDWKRWAGTATTINARA